MGLNKLPPVSEVLFYSDVKSNVEITNSPTNIDPTRTIAIPKWLYDFKIVDYSLDIIIGRIENTNAASNNMVSTADNYLHGQFFSGGSGIGDIDALQFSTGTLKCSGSASSGAFRERVYLSGQAMAATSGTHNLIGEALPDSLAITFVQARAAQNNLELYDVQFVLRVYVA